MERRPTVFGISYNEGQMDQVGSSQQEDRVRKERLAPFAAELAIVHEKMSDVTEEEVEQALAAAERERDREDRRNGREATRPGQVQAL